MDKASYDRRQHSSGLLPAVWVQELQRMAWSGTRSSRKTRPWHTRHASASCTLYLSAFHIAFFSIDLCYSSRWRSKCVFLLVAHQAAPASFESFWVCAVLYVAPICSHLQVPSPRNKGIFCVFGYALGLRRYQQCRGASDSQQREKMLT